MQQRGGDRAVQPDDLASFDFRLTRAGKQDAIDRFPRLGPDGRWSSGLEELRVGFLDGRRALDGLHRDMRFFSKLRP
jgi:hypothetical protein